MRRTPLRIGAIITGPDRQSGRFVLNSTPTVTAGANLWKAGRLHAAATARRRLRRNIPQRIKGGLADAGRRFLMFLGIL